MNDLIKKIKGFGYWKILIHPNEYNETLIPSITEAKSIIEENKVHLRGWDYPHVERVLKTVSPDSIDSSCEWEEGGKYEYWRYYLSGQFVHYFAMREDLKIDKEYGEKIKARMHFRTEDLSRINSFLGILSTIYSFTEIFLFASRLAEKGVLGESFHLEIELNGVKDRMLFTEETGRDLYSSYICNFEDNKITLSFDVTKADIIANYSDLALDNAFKIFNNFSWENPSREVFKEDQRKFLERRF